jgi:hypothetical protein
MRPMASPIQKSRAAVPKADGGRVSATTRSPTVSTAAAVAAPSIVAIVARTPRVQVRSLHAAGPRRRAAAATA